MCSSHQDLNGADSSPQQTQAQADFTALHKVRVLHEVHHAVWGFKIAGHHHCAACGAGVWGLKDQLSINEFFITHMCQECQDEVFESGFEDPFFDSDMEEAIWAAKQMKDNASS